MSKLKILHAADFHLDSAFEGLTAEKAVRRRQEQRMLLRRMAELVRHEKVDMVLLCGDLFDSQNSYHETGEELIKALRLMEVPVLISPGNHDCYTLRSPYARLEFPENVYIFPENVISSVTLKKFGVRVYGGAFTEKHSGALLENFRAADDGHINLLCLHGDVGAKDSPYNPVSEEALSRSGLHYAAFGHIHKASGLRKAGNTWYSWPGCPEGRGFDETGEKYVNIVELSDRGCSLKQVSVAMRKYEIMKVDVTGTDPLLAIHTRLPDDTDKDCYRIILHGEVDNPPNLERLSGNLAGMFFALQLRDETKSVSGLWDAAGEGTLRGIFLGRLKRLYDDSNDEAQRRKYEQAARWGLAALENREEPVRYEDQ